MIPALITRSFEAIGLRGAPTILGHLERLVDGNRLATVRLQSGESITFPAFDSYWCRYLYAGVPFEPDVEAIFRRFASGRTMIDCGANIGYWSARAERLGFVSAIAIEANAKLIPILKRNFTGEVHHAAVHSTSGKRVFLVGQGAAGHLGSFGEPVTTLALRDLKISGPLLVKLDVEGAEIEAIKGAEGLDAIFVYEDWPKSGMLVTKYLLDNDYAVFGYDECPILTHDEAFDFNKRTNKTYGPSNFVAISPRSRHDRPLSSIVP